MKPVVVFDVNGTLLDLSALCPLFDQYLNDSGALYTWFSHMLHSSLVMNEVGSYADLTDLAEAALEQTAFEAGAGLPPEAREEILLTMKRLPPYPDVEENLENLQREDYRLAALTNSPASTLQEQMESAGLTGRFEKLLTVEEVRKYKPAPEPYQHAAKSLGISPGDLIMVASHDWDIAGAMHAGCTAAYLERPGRVYNEHYPRPTYWAKSMPEVVAMILSADKAATA